MYILFHITQTGAVEELYGTRYQSDSFSLINVGSGFQCLRSFFPQTGNIFSHLAWSLFSHPGCIHFFTPCPVTLYILAVYIFHILVVYIYSHPARSHYTSLAVYIFSHPAWSLFSHPWLVTALSVEHSLCLACVLSRRKKQRSSLWVQILCHFAHVCS